MLSPRVLFVLPVSGGGGGANSVVQESIGLRRFGVPASIALKDENRTRFVASYPELQAMNVPVISYNSTESLTKLASQSDVICATTNGSVKDVKAALDSIAKGPKPKAAYYVQDYEPLFYQPQSPDWQVAYDSFTLIAGCALFAKTKWLCDIVYENHGVRMAKVEPSIDHDIYYPDLSRKHDRLTISAMLRPQTPRRAPRRTLRVMEMLADQYGSKVSLEVFGTPDAALKEFGMKLSPRITNHGSLRRTEVPTVLRNSDMFLDLSDFQAFGRTGLESMACACVPVVPNLGGSSEYAKNQINCYAVDTRSDTEVLESVSRFISLSNTEREQMRLAALSAAGNYTVARAALSQVQFFHGLFD